MLVYYWNLEQSGRYQCQEPTAADNPLLKIQKLVSCPDITPEQIKQIDKYASAVSDEKIVDQIDQYLNAYDQKLQEETANEQLKLVRLLIEDPAELTASSVRLYSAKPLEELLVPDKSELRRFIAQNIVRRRPKKPVLKLIPTFAVFMLLIENQAFDDSILLHLFEQRLKTLSNVVDNKYTQKYEVSMVSEEASLEPER